jgi:subtilisin family serine protease
VRRALALAAAAGALAAPASAASAPAFTPNDPLVPRQWYLVQDRAFDAWAVQPPLAPVLVAVVDSGIDAAHPEFAGRIARTRSFVGGSARVDALGHGTFVAGEIAAATGNGQGIAGIAPSAKLLVAKVVNPDHTISLSAEAAAIRWAVANRARVINLSLGGLRDPADPRRDTFSRAEAAAVAYAYAHGALVVAAVGNSDQAPRTPWPYASYPAALPHVLGVGAIGRDGNVPAFSDRDPIYTDIAAPGEDIVSTLPRALTARNGACADQGYSPCGPKSYRVASGTSFAAPQVSAAAALVLGTNPSLAPGQVTTVLERAAADANAATGCRRCALGRDALSGWGSLDVTKAVGALALPLPARDRLETNDDAGAEAPRLWGRRGRFSATIDYWDDPVDVYSVYLADKQRLSAKIRLEAGTNARLLLWKPGTRRVRNVSPGEAKQRIAQALGPRRLDALGYRAPAGGWYYVEVKVVGPGAGPYTLTFSKR